MEKYHSVEYNEYMKSDKWFIRKQRLFRKRGYVCEMCAATWPLEVHHLNYDRLGHELDDDLLIVCTSCHPKADRKRIEWEARRKYQREHPPKWATLEEIEALTMRIVNNHPSQPSTTRRHDDNLMLPNVKDAITRLAESKRLALTGGEKC